MNNQGNNEKKKKKQWIKAELRYRGYRKTVSLQNAFK